MPPTCPTFGSMGRTTTCCGLWCPPRTVTGQGVQVDLMVSYAFTDQFSLGVGGRYWAMWTTSGETNFGGSGLFIPQRLAVEQASVLVQGSYKFGESCCSGPLK